MSRFKKGQYENAVEYAKDLLSKGTGFTEILEKTSLNEKEAKKVINKREKEINDKPNTLF